MRPRKNAEGPGVSAAERRERRRNKILVPLCLSVCLSLDPRQQGECPSHETRSLSLSLRAGNAFSGERLIGLLLAVHRQEKKRKRGAGCLLNCSAGQAC
jgi:hypothetical protein